MENATAFVSKLSITPTLLTNQTFQILCFARRKFIRVRRFINLGLRNECEDERIRSLNLNTSSQITLILKDKPHDNQGGKYPR